VWKPILINSVALMVLSYIPFFIILLLFSAPTAFLTSLINQDLAAWSIVVTFVLAWLFKVSIGDTFAIAAIMATYFKETQNLAPDPQMQEQVAKVSDKFRELQQRAMQALGNQVPMPPQYPQTGVR
jgi:hypothetical protein